MLTITLGLLLPAVAVAGRWTPSQVNTAIRVADAHWPNSPCLHQHHIVWQSFDELQATLDEMWPGYIQPGMIGFGSLEGCQVWIAWDQVPDGPRWLCTLLEHEFGHNAGLGHSKDQTDVMYPYLYRPSADCRAAFPRARNRWAVYHWGRR